MPIQNVSGDLFANEFKAEAFAHGCNCLGVMGAGVALGFKQRYPAMYLRYQLMCTHNPRQFNPGDVFFWNGSPGQASVFNLATQEDIRENKATYEDVATCLRKMRSLADEKRIVSIAIPKIASGLGGLEWGRVNYVIHSIFDDWRGALFVYTSYMPERRMR